MENTGFLTVHTTTAKDVFPVADALVTISLLSPEGQTKLLAAGVTDQNGRTADFSLPCILAEGEESGARPVFLVQVSHPDYTPAATSGIEILRGAHSFLPVYLLPLSV